MATLGVKMKTATPTRNDVIDIVILSKRGASAIKEVLKEASKDPKKWVRHQFIIVFSNTGDDAVQDLGSWYQNNREEIPLPNVVARQAPDIPFNMNALRQYALKLGTSPYVYFQDDDDPLPQGIDLRIDMMNMQNWDAIFGVTETFNIHNQTVEIFPPVTPSGMYLYDPSVGNKLYPTYSHPCAALFRRSTLETVGIDDNQEYKIIGSSSFLTRLLHAGHKVSFLPDIVRRVRHHNDNSTGAILSEEDRLNLASDTRVWMQYIRDQNMKEFQENIANDLENGEITTYKEIDSLVESKLDELA